MTTSDQQGTEIATTLSGQVKSKDTRTRMAEMQRIAIAVQQLAEDLKTVDCGLEITMGDTRTALLFSAMLGLEDEEEITETRGETETGQNELPMEVDRLTLPRVRMGAIREGQKDIFLDEINTEEFLANCLDGSRIKRNAIPELIIRFAIGNPDEIFDTSDLVELFIALGAFKKTENALKLTDYRLALARVVRKLVACKFLKMLRKGSGRHGAIYQLNPDFDLETPYIRRHFFEKIHPQFYRTRKKPTQRYRIS